MRFLSNSIVRRLSFFMVLLVLCASSLLYANDEDAGDRVALELQAQIADITLKIDEQTVQNQRSAYPVLFYNDIIYFPITYNYMQALGLQSSWEADKGLSVATNPKGAQTLIQDLLPSEAADQIPGVEIAAVTPVFPITVQGKAVRAQSDWPFLLYNDITYMPATWEYMVTTMGLTLEYNNETRTLSLGGYGTTGNKVTLADITGLSKIFAIDSGAEQSVGMTAVITLMTSGSGDLLAEKLSFNYGGIIDSESKQILYALTPDPATTAKLNIDSIQMYSRPNATDASKMDLYAKEDGSWKLSTATMPLAPDMFVGAPLSRDEASRQADVLDSIGLSGLAATMRDPSANRIYSLYKNFYLDKTNTTATIRFDGSVNELLTDFGVTDTNLSKFYGYILSLDGLTGSAVGDEQGREIRALLQYSNLKLSGIYDIATGNLQSQTLHLTLKLSETDIVAEIEMDIAFDYSPTLDWPEID